MPQVAIVQPRLQFAGDARENQPDTFMSVDSSRIAETPANESTCSRTVEPKLPQPAGHVHAPQQRGFRSVLARRKRLPFPRPTQADAMRIHDGIADCRLQIADWQRFQICNLKSAICNLQ